VTGGGGSRKSNEPLDYVKKIVESRKTNGVDERTQKIAITEYSLDHWRAQNQGLNIDNLPTRFEFLSRNREDRDFWQELKTRARIYASGSLPLARNQMK
jgi:hypothetical protein